MSTFAQLAAFLCVASVLAGHFTGHSVDCIMRFPSHRNNVNVITISSSSSHHHPLHNRHHDILLFKIVIIMTDRWVGGDGIRFSMRWSNVVVVRHAGDRLVVVVACLPRPSFPLLPARVVAILALVGSQNKFPPSSSLLACFTTTAALRATSAGTRQTESVDGQP